ncbi:MAG: Gfo/Idh/MocA family oxidoreductase [Thermoleophilia bacterium]|nr:Gfo/Idh/MocA family oxidoreductase [Thermoleophilia bacterium]
MAPLGIGIVGTGFAAAAHVDALRRLPEARLVAVAASSDAKAERFAARTGAERGYGDWRALLEDDAVEVVHDCTPNHLHAPLNAAALDAGKHLLSEKPLGVDSGETAALASQAAAAGLVAGVCFNYRHYPLVRQLKGMLGAGGEGRAHAVRGAYLQDWLLEETDWNWRLEPERAGASRAVGDIGSHWLDLVEHVTGDRVVAVCAELGRLHERRVRPAETTETFAHATGEGDPVEIRTEDFAHVLLRFRSGCRGLLAISQVTAGRKNRLLLEVDTPRAAFAWDQEEPNTLWIGRRDGANAALPRDPALLRDDAAPLAHYPGGHQEGWPDALRNLVAEFYAAVVAHREWRPYEPSFATFADAHRTMRLVEAVVESDRRSGWVEVAAER